MNQPYAAQMALVLIVKRTLKISADGHCPWARP